MNDQSKTAPHDATDLRERFESVAPVILVDPQPVVRRGRRRRAAARAGAGLGVIAAAVAVAIAIVPGAPTGTTPPASDSAPPPEPDRPVAVHVVPQVVGPGGTVTAVLVASEPNELTFGVAAEVERWDGAEWRRAGSAKLCLVWWPCVGTVSDRLGPVQDIGLGASPGAPGPATTLSTEGLVDGWYRLVQHAALDDGVATGVFEVRAGAGTAPPLPPQDEVRLVVEPALVAPEGGIARIVTEVPAGEDGTLTKEDIEEVDTTLAPMALLQRWDGEQWLDVVDVPVAEREPDLGVERGSPVVLPELDEGSYRLVRTRPDAPDVWGVFTVVAGVPPLERPGPGSDLE